MDKEYLKKIAAKAMMLEKTDKLGLAKEFLILEDKINKLEESFTKEVKEAVDEVKASELDLPRVLENIRGKDGESITGDQGEQGIQGIQGIQGKKGDKGLPGKDGLDGKDGVDGQDGLHGLDGSPDKRLQIVEKINTGKKKDLKIELKQIEGTEKMEKGIMDRAISILDQRTQFLINKGVKHGSTLSGEGTDASPLSVAGVWLNDNSTVNARLTVSATAPSNPVYGELWYDIS